MTSGVLCFFVCMYVCMYTHIYYSSSQVLDISIILCQNHKAAVAYARFTSLAAQLGVALALDKRTPPMISLIWLGFSIIDTVNDPSFH